ncbi:MAG TPA: hypothetical protein VFK05_00495 [Polyangiaceae bacterium]|nr:hypothetical protein [Polyangiaceae bacterium]
MKTKSQARLSPRARDRAFGGSVELTDQWLSEAALELAPDVRFESIADRNAQAQPALCLAGGGVHQRESAPSVRVWDAVPPPHVGAWTSPPRLLSELSCIVGATARRTQPLASLCGYLVCREVRCWSESAPNPDRVTGASRRAKTSLTRI